MTIGIMSVKTVMGILENTPVLFGGKMPRISEIWIPAYKRRAPLKRLYQNEQLSRHNQEVFITQEK